MAFLLSRGCWGEEHSINSQWMPFLDKARKLAAITRAKTTTAKYLYNFKRFKTWCDRLEVTNAFPASAEVVGFFLTKVAEEAKSHSALLGQVSAIKWAHKLCGYNDPTLTGIPAAIIEGAKRSILRQTVAKLPITVDMLEKIVTNCCSSECSLRDWRFGTMAVLAFAGFFRIAELRVLKFSDLVINKDYILAKLPRSKTDVYGKGEEVLVSKSLSEGKIPIVSIVQKYAEISGHQLNSTAFMFRNLSPDGKCFSSGNKPIIYSRARHELQCYFKFLGWDFKNFGWHSFRRGGATCAAQGGVEIRLVQRHGRWKTVKSMNKYVIPSIKEKIEVTRRMI